ncbi:fumarylacetoacetate hydrolase family protein [Aquibacillus koreensis]|uniref:Fumarylacetoacetate hydrolase family protein n=1 Tax=Aquibacillus koreensis TaxID=279446 RepID=A0A9X3WPN6_9BACI|nr:fumarylacetoacetate hydrolase family protein [Aquibacillus koreensis]MCT2534186.1 fumarylacetoacetate hydrolase family protein [Aquibacillus koreensis]MDC3422578.1 fumarylacetoacetate hydrolase family protein [Aquibacillus koreensis]
MRLSTLKQNGLETAAIRVKDNFVLMESINHNEGKEWPVEIYDLLQQGKLEEVIDWYENGGKAKLLDYEKIPMNEVIYAPLYRRPRKIWGVGLNYIDSSEQSLEDVPYSDPVSFMKPDTSIIGPEDNIQIPHQSKHTTAEAELAIIIGKECYDISEEESEGVIAGYTTAFDMTESKIHSENHRFLTRAKSFNTFFSFGPELITKGAISNVSELVIQTVLNGEKKHENTVMNMRYSPYFIVSFHSKVMTLLPGDIILTGTPGAVLIRDGDVVESHITGFQPLINKVVG